MHRLHVWAPAAAVLTLFASAAWAQAPASAVDLVRQAAAAHGDDSAPEVSFQVRYAGLGRSGGQSVAIAGPYEPYPQVAEFGIDNPSKSVVIRRGGPISGDFTFVQQVAVRDGQGFRLDTSEKTWSPADRVVSQEFEPFLPGRLVRRALEAPAGLSLSQAPGADVVRIVFREASGRQLLIDLGARDHLVRRVETVPTDPGTYGGQGSVFEYPAYRKVAGIAAPERVAWTQRSAAQGPQLSEFNLLAATEGFKPEPAAFNPPADARKIDPAQAEPFAVVDLGNGVKLLRNLTEGPGPWTYNVMAVAFSDHLLVAEAPVTSAVTEKVLAKLGEAFPDKPVRFVVQSHHHGDHLGGIRPYIADGATLVTPPGLTPLIAKVAAVRQPEARADRQTKAPRDPIVQELSTERRFVDGANEVVVFNIPGDPHSGNTLVTWLPKLGVLYQADLVNAGVYPANATTAHFLRWLKAKKLPVKTLVGLHGRVLNEAEVEALLRS